MLVAVGAMGAGRDRSLPKVVARDISQGGALALAQSKLPTNSTVIAIRNNRIQDGKRYIWVCAIDYKVKE